MMQRHSPMPAAVGSSAWKRRTVSPSVSQVWTRLLTTWYYGWAIDNHRPPLFVAYRSGAAHQTLRYRDCIPSRGTALRYHVDYKG